MKTNRNIQKKIELYFVNFLPNKKLSKTEIEVKNYQFNAE
jgi:hypothetical protein